MSTRSVKDQLLARGVLMDLPESVSVADNVKPERIAPGVTIHSGCRLEGAELSIGPGSSLGREAPLTLVDSQLGHDVVLAGGFCSGATLLDGVEVGSCAHIRPGTLLEEQSSCAHSVGLKQTILMPFVTLGSLINFCDVLMAGGSGSSRHSEVGSSYVHFNFTAQQDKATASLLGDVSRGVMLDQPPIFLGGQGGLVGPSTLEYGTITGAGTVFRGDVTEPGQLIYGDLGRPREPVAFDPAVYGHVTRKVRNNLLYLANLFALREWYERARRPWMQSDPFRAACLEGALIRLQQGLQERIKRLDGFAGKLPGSLALAGKQSPSPGREACINSQRAFLEAWPAIHDRLHGDLVSGVGEEARQVLLAALSATDTPGGWTDQVRSLPPAARQAGTAWLQAVVDGVVGA